MSRTIATFQILHKIRFSLLIIFVMIINVFFIRLSSKSFPAGIFTQNKYLSYIVGTPSQPINCIVYMQFRKGRLGNRMFMVASAYGLARLHSCHLYLTPSVLEDMNNTFVLDLQPILLSSAAFTSVTSDVSNSMKRTSRYVVCHYISALTHPNAIPKRHVFELRGFWQSYLHFAKYGNKLREQIFVGTRAVLHKVAQFFIDFYPQQFGLDLHDSADEHTVFKNRLKESKETTWIGIHVRRSDFLSINFSSSDEYLFTAIDYFTTQYPKAHFIVASDDKPYCQALFRNRSNVSITPGSFSAGDDLITLSLCEHSIVTGGSFGWWSAFLANGIVMHDRTYTTGCKRREHYYPPWFLVDRNVSSYVGSNFIL
jgi:hypothetical protein